MKRTIIFGDIHACYEEWQDLMDKLSVTSSDRLIAVGDLVCKGPSTIRTLDLAMSLSNLRCIMGNHDFYILKNWQAGCLEELSGVHAAAIAEMNGSLDHYMHFISAWPFFIETPEFIALHGGIQPDLPLIRQTPHDLTHLRTLEDGRPWFEAYTGKKPIVFGHWARRGLIVRDNAIGLDTGCVYGGKLTACVFPGREIVSVPARRQYASTEKKS